ncbi:MAG: 50S ribosomal protein L11 methyltransferase [Chloroflexota bacterium]|nr:MAG: 50S ribosomal protein L11 methyltransferase [Chloroflexota bacterium]
MYWLEVSVTADGEAAEAIAEVLWPYTKGDGVVMEQKADPSKPDPQALEPEVTVKMYLPEEQDLPEVRAKIEESLYHLGRLYPIPEPQFRRLQDEDWATAWRKHYRPFRVGRNIWIHPSWLKPDELKPSDTVISVDPGMAFGTGLHPSTQMCLQKIEDLILPGKRVLDIGTGSGILSIAAAKLGAERVVALDTDRLAVLAAAENVQRNGVEAQVWLFQGELNAIHVSAWDLVVVNILAPVIIQLLSKVHLADFGGHDGQLVLSGIIEEQEPDVLTALAATSMVVTDRKTIRDWVCLTARNQKAPPISVQGDASETGPLSN